MEPKRSVSHQAVAVAQRQDSAQTICLTGGRETRALEFHPLSPIKIRKDPRPTDSVEQLRPALLASLQSPYVSPPELGCQATTPGSPPATKPPLPVIETPLATLAAAATDPAQGQPPPTPLPMGDLITYGRPLTNLHPPNRAHRHTLGSKTTSEAPLGWRKTQSVRRTHHLLSRSTSTL